MQPARRLLPLLIVAGALGACRGAAPVPANLDNLSFEGSGDWSDLTTWTHPYYAPVDGEAYAVVAAGAPPTTKRTGVVLEEGERYELTVWSRSVYLEDKTLQLRDDERKPNGTELRSIATVAVVAGETVLAEAQVDVSPPILGGDATLVGNDDGANVFLDGGHRMQITSQIFSQPAAADPLEDPWISRGLVHVDYDGLAPAPLVGNDTPDLLYACSYIDGEDGVVSSSLDAIGVTGVAPDYTFDHENREVLFSHTGSEDPWVIDPQPFADPATGRLWMVWGGHVVWISELDPETGGLLVPQDSLDIQPHDEGVHTAIASAASGRAVGATQDLPESWAEEGDGWSSGYTEGASVFGHDGLYYLFSSYGNLGSNYTIRMGRAEAPTGPYVDKDGREMLTYHPDIDYYGQSFLLGNDGNQLVPGHPHVWEENGTFYLGFDYRVDISDPDIEEDRMGIRALHWENGWPTIWTPISVEIDARDFPDAVGQELEIHLGTDGEAGSVVAFDHVSFEGR